MTSLDCSLSDPGFLRTPLSTRRALERIAEVDCRPHGNHTLLMLAARHGRHRTVRFLIGAGADVALTDEQQRNALYGVRNAASARALLEAGADVNARDKDGQTPLHMAASPEVAVALLEAGADWTIQDDFGVTAEQCLEGRGPSAGDIVAALHKWVARQKQLRLEDRLHTQSAVEPGPSL